MNINQIQAALKAATKTDCHIDRARSMLAAQCRAAQSRSHKAYAVECDAHLGAAMCLSRAKRMGCTDLRTLSILGGIAKESQFRFSGGEKNPARQAIRA
jgi:hypothetical protein